MNEVEVIAAMKAAGIDKQKKKTPTYNMTDQQLKDLENRIYDKAYHEAYVNALKDANDLLVLLSCMYMIDNFRCKENGLLKFIEYYEHMNDLYSKEQFTLNDLATTIKEETGLDILAGDEKKYARKALVKC